MPEADFVELSHPHVSKNHPYSHVDAFVRDKITCKKVRDIGHGYPVDR